MIVTSHKLRPNFQANPILVMTDQPIKKSMNKPEVARRMIQWAIEFSQFDIEYHPRIAINAQAQADFIVEFTILNKEGATDKVERWTIQNEGLLVRKRGGVGVIIITPEGETLKYGVQLAFLATNNEAKYEGVLMRLRVGKALGVKNLLLQSDSKLVIGQIKGELKQRRKGCKNT